MLPSTWVAGRFGVGNWTTVSGLRQPDGTIVASRLDPARAGALAVRGKVIREHDITRIGHLVLHGPAAAAAKPGTFVLVVGRYVDGAAEVTSIDPDLLSEDPVGYLALSARQLVVQGFVRVASGTVWLNNGQQFKAGPEVQGKGSGYRNAIVWLTRTADGSFVATQLHYTNYRAQPQATRSGPGGHGSGPTGATTVFAPRADNGRSAGECDRYGSGSRHAAAGRRRDRHRRTRVTERRANLERSSAPVRAIRRWGVHR